jgi:hypothetical protein
MERFNLKGIEGLPTEITPGHSLSMAKHQTFDAKILS